VGCCHKRYPPIITMRYFVLADCNNFYVSCERLFNPKLENKPVIILSNNDGCVVARSEEAKKLGIKMGEPFFKIKDFCERKNVMSFSSNYSLYGDLSKRVMEILTAHSEESEIYSIDEAFLTFSSGLSSLDVLHVCSQLRQKVKQWVGIPISLGIAPTKTLAKVANHHAKKKTTCGVFDLTDPYIKEAVLKQLPVGEIWGIGKQLAQRLHAKNIFSAFELSCVTLTTIKQWMGVVGERIVLELQGVSCLDLEQIKPKKAISVSRSFGDTLYTLQPIQEALCYHITSGCRKLREQGLLASGLHVYLESRQLGGEFARNYFGLCAYLHAPSDFTPHFLHQGSSLLASIFQEGLPYKKCGILLTDLIPASAYKPDLFSGKSLEKQSCLMQAVDSINHRYGKNSVAFGSSLSQGKLWQPTCKKKSSYSTTSWDDLPIVKAD
jgi:DNA polymerase V